jgi:hypothetical protein
VLHVDLTVPLLVLASPLVILGLLRMVASIADRRVAERSDALVRELERIEPETTDGGATSGSGSSGSSSTESDATHLTGTKASHQG